MSVIMRQHIERMIVRRVILDALRAGYSLNVNNGGDLDELPEPTTDRKLILDTMFATDEDRLDFYPSTPEQKGGWVYFVYGNDGYDVISDYTTNLETVLEGANKLACKLHGHEYAPLEPLLER